MTDVKPDIDATLAFLARFEPEGPWSLYAKTDNNKFIVDTFHPGQEDKVRAFMEKHASTCNMYVAINPPITDLQKKAKREDLKEMRWLHVDVDSRAGEELEDELFRIKTLMGEKRPAILPEPTMVIYSGGGYWGLWRLEEPVPINGSVATCEDLHLYNMQISQLLGGDNCHNLDRIMRLPGSINFPDENKRRKGRKVTLTTVAEARDVSYPLDRFVKATPLQTKDTGFTSVSNPGIKVDISGNVAKVSGPEELDQWKVPDRIKLIAWRGREGGVEIHGPKEGDNSRSAWLFDGVCGLVKAGVPDETIYSILMDSEWGISESILDKGSAAQKHAQRTIERAKLYTKDPILAEMNDKFAVISSIGGRCLIIEEIYDDSLDRYRLVKQGFDHFGNRHKHRKVEMQGKDGPLYIPLGKWWTEHPDRRQYESIVFNPEREDPSKYNLWRGLAFEARPGDCSLYLTHLKEVVCGGNEEHYQYLLKWMARAVQYPGSQGEVAIVLRGEQGTGKGMTIKIFGRLFGRHFLQISDSKHLVGNFNGHLRDAVLVFADEAFFAGDKKHESILKTLVTEPHLMIESKGVDAEIAANCIHLMMASNSNWVVPAGDHERRFFVLDVKNTHRQDRNYFKAMIKQMESGGYEALLLELKSMKVGRDDFDVTSFPRTKALSEQQDYTLTYEESWWYEKLKSGDLLEGKPGWPDHVVKDALFEDWIQHAKRLNIQRRGTQTAWYHFLAREIGTLASKQRLVTVKDYDERGVATVRKERKYTLEMPSLARCREIWDSNHGGRNWAQVVVEPPPELPDTLPTKSPF
jgi:hypothetical protein